MKLKVLLKGLALSVFFLVLTLKGFTQKNYFIYIQADNKQPFYLVMNQKKLNSSPIGYLIVPKLAPDEYKVQLGFPDNQAPEQDFVIKVDKKDAGYALKKFDNGWGLFNFQTMDVIMGVPREAATTAPPATTSVEPAGQTIPETTSAPTDKKVETKTAPKKNAFGDMLSDAMNDPDLAGSIVATEAVVAAAAPKTKAPPKGTKQKTPATKHAETTKKQPEDKKETQQPETVAAAVPPPDSSVAAIAPPDAPVNTTAAINETYDAAGTKGVIKLSELSDEKGVDLVFLDFNSKSSDTIRLFIPAELAQDSTDTTVLAVAKPTEEKRTAEETKVYNPNEKPLASANNDTSVAENKADSGAKGINNPFFDKSAQPSGAAAAAVAVTAEKPSEKKTDSVSGASPSPVADEPKAPSAMVNNQCTKMATDEDLIKWKKKMISANGDKGMLQAVKKLMSGKCLTTDQVKELGGLFLSDEGRYNFFDEAYLYTYDFGKYPVLENQLFDSYYKKRFKAILRF
ncbi:DUF4476 domain-containing protein [Danxiaibacter flavus]|uniref:DUF4476 domain-containing protein n=1 Tax=Danxiaibacter flavus TaxID=3049108 RepID=A0ABV3ZLC7_9BACT|nr:DUF4476 domain-containing protein [Chitinophagaceae bacterium DXS]